MKINFKLTLFVVLVFSIVNLSSAHCREIKRIPSNTKKKTFSKPTTSLSFEDEVVEWMNKKPLDSIESTVNKENIDRSYLYHKRTHFRKELMDSSLESGFYP